MEFSVASEMMVECSNAVELEMRKILIATSNPGKLRDFAGAALRHGVEIAAIPDFSSLPPVVEDGMTFEKNACKKAEEYSRYVPGEMVVADDSGLEVDALDGAPGVHSARYSAPDLQNKEPHEAQANTDDEANNARVVRELRNVPAGQRTGRFVCVLAVARDGKTLATFRGTAEGIILDAPRGTNGFGYDPLFYFPQIKKTFAELTAEEKSTYSHRGAAFRQFLSWCAAGAKSSLRMLPPENRVSAKPGATVGKRLLLSLTASVAASILLILLERTTESKSIAVLLLPGFVAFVAIWGVHSGPDSRVLGDIVFAAGNVLAYWPVLFGLSYLLRRKRSSKPSP